MDIGVINGKGGTQKTTTAVALACGLAQRGRRVLLVDMDPQGSALSWGESGELGFEVLAPGELTGRDEEGWDDVIFDTPPFDLAAMRRALLLCDVALIPLAPTMVEVRKLYESRDGSPSTLQIVEEARAEHPGLRLGVLLTKVRYGTRAGGSGARREGAPVVEGVVRQALVALELPVLRAEVPLREEIATSFGAKPGWKDHMEFYGPVLDEVMALAAGEGLTPAGVTGVTSAGDLGRNGAVLIEEVIGS